jgi:uncharacterized membrane protein
MPFIAWVLLVYFSLASLASMSSLIAKGMKEAKSAAEGTATAVSILMTAAFYAWLIWIVVQLGTR